MYHNFTPASQLAVANTNESIIALAFAESSGVDVCSEETEGRENSRI